MKIATVKAVSKTTSLKLLQFTNARPALRNRGPVRILLQTASSRPSHPPATCPHQMLRNLHQRTNPLQVDQVLDQGDRTTFHQSLEDSCHHERIPCLPSRLRRNPQSGRLPVLPVAAKDMLSLGAHPLASLLRPHPPLSSLDLLLLPQVRLCQPYRPTHITQPPLIQAAVRIRA
jgi:hypothetical protein